MTSTAVSPSRDHDRRRAIGRPLAASAALAAILCAGVSGSIQAAVAAEWQPSHAAPAGRTAHDPEGGEPGGREAEGEHESGVLDVIARLVNFGILAGALVYLLRVPLATHLEDRGTQIRKDLTEARAIQAAAARQLDEISSRLASLPGEIEALKTRGAEEVAREEARIRQLAEIERQRVLEQTRREIDLQLRVARRELVRLAADLAVGVAAEKIRTGITAEDQGRLVDRYLAQLH